MINDAGDNLVFLLGLPRSGTTLLCAMLANHPEVACPPEPWLMLALESFARTDPWHPADSELLGTAAREFIGGELHVQAARSYALTAYNEKLKQKNRSVLIDKTPRYFLIISYLQKVFPRARLIWLKRNPLDVAASYKNTWNADIPKLLDSDSESLACIDWVIGLQRLLQFDSAHPGLMHSVHYEELSSAPDASLRAIFKLLNLAVPEDLNLLDLIPGEMAHSFAGDKKILNTSKPHNASIGTWKQAFTHAELQTLLDAAGSETFRALGYSATLDALADRGVVDRGPDVAAQWRERLEAKLARRLQHVEAASTYGSDRTNFPFMTPEESKLFQADYCRIVGELEATQRALQIETEKYEGSLANASELTQHIKRMEGELIQVHDALARTSRDKEEAQIHVADLQADRWVWIQRLREVEGTIKNIESWNLAEHLFHGIRGFLADAVEEPGSLLPKLSIVTQFGSEDARTVRATIDSVLAQKIPDLEYTLVIRGPNDELIKIAEQYRGSVTTFYEPDFGIFNAIHKGLLIASGDVLSFIHPGTVYEPGALHRVREYFAQHGAAKVAYFEETRMTGGWRFAKPLSPIIDLYHLLKGTLLNPASVFFRREAYWMAGGVNPGLKFTGDYDLLLRLARKFMLERAEGHVCCSSANPSPEYLREVDETRTAFLKNFGPVARMRRWPRHLLNRYENLVQRDVLRRFDYAVADSNGAAETPTSQVQPICPITGAYPDRFILSTGKGRVGKAAAHIYYNTRNHLAIRAEGESPANSAVLVPAIAKPSHHCGGANSDLDLDSSEPRALNDSRGSCRSETAARLLANFSKGSAVLLAGVPDDDLIANIAREKHWKLSIAGSGEFRRSFGEEKAWHADIEDIPLIVPEEMSFDAIVLQPELQTFQDPVQVVKRLAHVLAPGGILVVSAPNLDSRLATLFQAAWIHWHLPRNRYLYSARSLSLLAEYSDLTLGATTSYTDPFWAAMSLQLAKNGIDAEVHTASQENVGEDFKRPGRGLAERSREYWDDCGQGDLIVAALKK